MSTAKDPKVPPGPYGKWIGGTSGAFQKNVLEFLTELNRSYGDAIRYRFALNIYGYIFTNPDHNKYVLQENSKNFTRNVPIFNMLRKIQGNGLLVSEGELWLRQRR